MAVDKLVDSTQLDSDLTSVANAIRTKGGTSAQLAFPSGFVTAVQNIPTGITPTGTKQISITQNGTTTENVTNYASAEITVNVSGGGGGGSVTQDQDGYIVLPTEGGGSSGVSRMLYVGTYNYFDNQLYCDVTNSNDLTRLCYGTVSGDASIKVYASSTDKNSLSPVHPIEIPSGSTSVSITVMADIQVVVSTYSVSGTSVTGWPYTSGWVNITSGTPLAFNFATGDVLGVSFRRDSSNTRFQMKTNYSYFPYGIEVEFS